MENGKVLVWIQIVTGFAVVLGLVLVIWELNLSRRIGVAQVTSDSYSLAAQSMAGNELWSLAMPCWMTWSPFLAPLTTSHTRRKWLGISSKIEIVRQGGLWADIAG